VSHFSVVSVISHCVPEPSGVKVKPGVCHGLDGVRDLALQALRHLVAEGGHVRQLGILCAQRGAGEAAAGGGNAQHGRGRGVILSLCRHVFDRGGPAAATPPPTPLPRDVPAGGGAAAGRGDAQNALAALRCELEVHHGGM
jgi:hypothetical protein